MKTPLALAARNFIENKERIARQAVLVKRLRSSSSDLLAEAERLLDTMQTTLDLARVHRQDEQNRWDRDARNY
jgi:hypothetical protein